MKKNLSIPEKVSARFSWARFFVWLIVGAFLLSTEVFAQTYYYQMNIEQRRMGDYIAADIWLKSTDDGNAANLGDMTINLTYNTAVLTHMGTFSADIDELALTDSIAYDVVDEANPYKTIESNFANALYGFNDLSAQPTGNMYALGVNLSASGAGFKPASTGKGSFVGRLIFQIQDVDFGCDDLTQIDFANSTFITVTEAGTGNEISSNVEFVSPGDFTVRGITILSPNKVGQAVNRYSDPEIAYFQAFNNPGYPIYFERSGLVDNNASGGDYGTQRFAYQFQYRLSPTGSWSEFGRVAETNQEQSAMTSADLAQNVSGEMDVLSNSGSNDLFISYADNAKLQSGFYSTGVLRVIWEGNENFPYRSEEADIRVRMLSETITADIDSRTAQSDACLSDITDATFVLGRLFFVQLDGTNDYFRTFYNYSNATQLTVEAWINLNSYPDPANTEAATGIVASSAGPTTDEEGAWLLYLDEGMYPAFRAREIEGTPERSLEGNYLAVVKSATPICTTSSASPIADGHADNWVHIAATVNDNIVTLYINGEVADQAINTKAVNARMLTTIHPIWVGLNPNSGDNPNLPASYEEDNYLHAGVKEVRVWRTALTQDQLRQNIAGVYDPDGTISAIAPTVTNADFRAALELDYTFQASNLDVADDTEFQDNANPLNYFEVASITGLASETNINYRPDRSHITLTSPTGGEGISNLKNETFEVRFAAYGLGKTSPSAAGEGDIQVMVSRDGGNTWFDAIDANWDMMDKVEIEEASAYWEPYKTASVADMSNDLQGLMPILTEDEDLDGNYTKSVLLKVSGTEDKGQDNIYDISESFQVAPYFALQNKGGAYMYIEESSALNLTGGSGMFEAWINTYSFPAADDYYPILSKKDPDSDTDIHYSFRLLGTGQLQLVVGSEAGTNLRTATSDINYALIPPNDMVFDSLWTHVAVYFNLADGGDSEVWFYIDGIKQNSELVQFDEPTGIDPDVTNTYPTYIGYEPGATPRTFIGAMKEVRWWNGNPGGMDNTGTGTDDMTKFIQGALSVRADEITEQNDYDYSQNLQAALILNGGGFINSGFMSSAELYPSSLGMAAHIVNNSFTADCGINYGGGTSDSGMSYVATKPFVKIVEPVYQQSVPNTLTSLKVRWVGFDYNRNDMVDESSNPVATFRNGSDAVNYPDLWYSVKGGGDLNWMPYTFVTSRAYSGSYPNAWTLPSSSAEYVFLGTEDKSQYASVLNMSTANPDINGDGIYNDYGEIPATMSNGRFKLVGRSYLNGSMLEYDNNNDGRVPSLRTETDVFNITPESNFTLRMLLEGYHKGDDEAFTANLGTSYTEGGMRISLFSNNAGTPGQAVGSTKESEFGYSSDATAKDPTTNGGTQSARGADGSEFANIPFVYTDIADGRYFVLVDHINHLPALSRYAAPFYYAGDDLETWEVESGWDFQTWNGTDSYITESEASENPPDYGTKYTAYEEGVDAPTWDKDDEDWGYTTLNYTPGQDQSAFTGSVQANSLAAMTAGDVNQDGQINAADRALIRINGSSYAVSYDVTGDGAVNGTDRQIVDFNNNKISAVPDAVLSMMAAENPGVIIPKINRSNPLEAYLEEAPDMTRRLNQAASDYIAKGGHYTHNSIEDYKVNQTLGGMQYKVFAEPSLNGEFVEVDFYIQNEGEEFAPGNCTFAVEFDRSSLEYVELITKEDVMFSNRPDMGYAKVYSAPTPMTKRPISSVRTVEIDYDAYTLYTGINVPYTRTYVGTLRFRIYNESELYSFSWYKSSVVHRTDGQNITGDGEFMPIESIVVPKETAVTVPNGGETWQSGSLYTVSWTQPSKPKPAFIEYSIDDGKTWNRINEEPHDIYNKNYNWVIPSLQSTECLVRLIEAESMTEIDRSDSWFAIVPSPAEITRPSSQDPVYFGESNDFIRWDVAQDQMVRLEFSAGGEGDWIAVSAPVNTGAGEVPWTIPVVNSKTARVRMVNVEKNEIVAISTPFRILAGRLTLTKPSAEEILTIGNNADICWTYNNVSKFDLQFSPDGGASWEGIENSVVALKGCYGWLVPPVKTQNGVVRAIYNNDPQMEYSRTSGFEIDGFVSVDDMEGEGFAFFPPTPNPFDNRTNIRFRLPFEEEVSITVYNAAGMKVGQLADGKSYPSGNHTLDFYGDDLPAGIYFIHFNAGLVNMTRTVVRIK